MYAPLGEHVDLILVRSGEKVSVEVPVVVSGDAASGTLVNQEMSTVLIDTSPAAIEAAVIGERQLP